MAFFFFVLSLIVLYIRPAEWIPFFAGWHLAVLTLVGTALFLLFQVMATKKPLIKVPHNGMMIGLLLAVVASHAVHTYFGGMINGFTEFFKILVMYYLIVNTIASKRQFQSALWVVILLTAILAIQGVCQYHTGHGWAGQYMAEGRRITWISIFDDPNDLAMTFVVMVPVLLAYLVKPGFFGLKVGPLSVLGLILYAIFLTNSRGGMLGLMISIVFFFVKRSRYILPGGIIGGILSGLVFVFGPSRLGVLSSQDASAHGRLDAWYYGFQLMKSSPIFGVGFDMFTDQYPLTAHNSFVLAASELGLFGLFFWVGLFYVSFKSMSLVQKHCPELAPYAYSLQAALVGFLATAFFLSRTYNPIPYLVCALAASLYAVAREQTDSVAFRFTVKDARNVFLLAVGSLVMAQLAMKVWL